MDSPKSRYLLPAISALALFVAGQSSAVEFESGELTGSFNSNISVGVSWSMEEADKGLISNGNGNDQTGSGFTGITDDGRLNFKKGETFSEIIKGVHDLSLNYKNYGAFFRGKYWYDNRLIAGRVHHGHVPTGYVPESKLDDGGFDDLAKFSGVALLDNYIYGSFDVGDAPLDIRLGDQVVSWGESTFISSGINSVNPVDVNTFRRPGAEVKEGLLPVGMLYASLGATENLTLEAFYQYEWQKTVIDGCGAFFSGLDPAASESCNLIILGGSSPLGNDKDLFDAGNTFITRDSDKEASDSGQYGIAARYFASNLNDTEFGAYYLRNNSAVPYFGVVGASTPGQSNTMKYFLEYPDEIEMYGLSFNTAIGDYSVAGEISYRPDQPVQINTGELLFGGILTNTASNVLVPLSSVIESGKEFSGYQRKPVTQAQVTVTRFFEQVLGASRLSVLGELGFSRVDDLGQVKLGRSSIYGLYDNCVVGGGLAGGNDCTNEGFVTKDSWGYRLLGALTYNNVLSGVNLTPKAAFSHDVSGYSASGHFNEGSKALSLALGADYFGIYNASISYTTFWGGDYNTKKDRDFASVSIGASF